MISIILPSYNVESFIEKCIQSILCQTLHDWELILVDDGSTDQTTKICRRYAAETENITYVRQENKGMGYARNLGLQYAKGSWVTFVDADDWVFPDFLKMLKKAQEEANADIVVCQYMRTFKDSENIDFNDRSYMASRLYRRDDEDFSDIFQFDFMPWGKLFRKSFLKGVPRFFRELPMKIMLQCPIFLHRQGQSRLLKMPSMCGETAAVH